jgi:hypothetical protein
MKPAHPASSIPMTSHRLNFRCYDVFVDTFDAPDYTRADAPLLDADAC